MHCAHSGAATFLLRFVSFPGKSSRLEHSVRRTEGFIVMNGIRSMATMTIALAGIASFIGGDRCARLNCLMLSRRLALLRKETV